MTDLEKLNDKEQDTQVTVTVDQDTLNEVSGGVSNSSNAVCPKCGKSGYFERRGCDKCGYNVYL